MNQSRYMTRHEQAEIYQLKSKIVGHELEFELCENDEVLFKKANNINSTGKIIIPSFVTGLKLDILDEDIMCGPLIYCKYEEIYVDNSPDIDFDASGLCAFMSSNKIKVTFSHPEKIINMESMFCECYEAISIDISGLANNHAFSMKEMFIGCEHLQKIIMGDFDAKYCKSMDSMFRDCEILNSVDLSKLNTEKLETAQEMFLGCKKLSSINLSNFITSNVINMCDMFGGCTALTHLDLSSFDTSNVKTMEDMFRNCRTLTYLDLSNFNTSNVTNMRGMFRSCKYLKIIDIQSFNVRLVSNFDAMFARCRSLEILDLKHFNPQVEFSMAYMFAHNDSLKTLDISGMVMTDYSENCDFYATFKGCPKLTSIKLKNPFPKRTVLRYHDMFDGCDSLDLSNSSLVEPS